MTAYNVHRTDGSNTFPRSPSQLRAHHHPRSPRVTRTPVHAHIVSWTIRLDIAAQTLYRTLMCIPTVRGTSMMVLPPATPFAATGESRLRVVIHRHSLIYICVYSEDLLALAAPATTKCDFCATPFCGIGVQQRCIALMLMSQQPHGYADMSDLVQSTELYECFNSNSVEVDYFIDYLMSRNIRPQKIYREV